MAFLEVVQYFKSIFRALGHDVSVAKNSTNSRRLNLILAGHLLTEIDHIPAASIVLNCEQLAEKRAWYKSALYRSLLERHTYWDYSATNLPHVTNDFKAVVPFLSCPALERLKKAPREIDLLFYGSMNDHRALILENLRRAGLRLHILQGIYGPERDAFLSQARAVLNLHFYEAQILEQVRCFYPLINGKAVISENFPENSAPSIYQTALFIPGQQDFVSYVAELLADREKFDLAAYNRTEAFRRCDPIPDISAALNSAVARWHAQKDLPRLSLPARINLGSGKDYRQGFLNIDIDPSVPADLRLDLGVKQVLPARIASGFGAFELMPDSIDEILAFDVIEHVADLVMLMTQCLALLREGGRMVITVPYDLSCGAWQDPTHVRAFNENSWLYYTEWFWYLGWLDHRFELGEMSFSYSPLGEKLKTLGASPEEIRLAPRAVDSMRVVLIKRPTTLEEKQLARAHDARFHMDL